MSISSVWRFARDFVRNRHRGISFGATNQKSRYYDTERIRREPSVQFWHPLWSREDEQISMDELHEITPDWAHFSIADPDIIEEWRMDNIPPRIVMVTGESYSLPETPKQCPQDCSAVRTGYLNWREAPEYRLAIPPLPGPHPFMEIIIDSDTAHKIFHAKKLLEDAYHAAQLAHSITQACLEFMDFISKMVGMEGQAQSMTAEAKHMRNMTANMRLAGILRPIGSFLDKTLDERYSERELWEYLDHATEYSKDTGLKKKISDTLKTLGKIWNRVKHDKEFIANISPITNASLGGIEQTVDVESADNSDIIHSLSYVVDKFIDTYEYFENLIHTETEEARKIILHYCNKYMESTGNRERDVLENTKTPTKVTLYWGTPPEMWNKICSLYGKISLNLEFDDIRIRITAKKFLNNPIKQDKLTIYGSPSPNTDSGNIESSGGSTFAVNWGEGLENIRSYEEMGTPLESNSLYIVNNGTIFPPLSLIEEEFRFGPEYDK